MFGNTGSKLSGVWLSDPVASDKSDWNELKFGSCCCLGGLIGALLCSAIIKLSTTSKSKLFFS